MTDRELRETQMDLMIGCLVHSLFFECIGLLVAANRLSFSAGLLLGTLAALAASISMYRGILSCVDLDPASARRRMTAGSIIRMLVIFVVCAVGLRSRHISFAGVLVGLVGLKTAAYLHVYTNVYITRKFFRRYL